MSKVNYTKLGVFAVAGALAATAGASVLSWRAFSEDTEDYHMFFSESVEGLELGTPLKFRGVKVGTVTEISIAPDGRHVHVTGALYEKSIDRILLDEASREQLSLCAQLSQKGLTGMQLVQLDLFEHGSCAPIDALPFTPRGHVIATMPSIVESLEVAVRRLSESAPKIAENLAQLATRVNRLVGDVETEPGQDPVTLAGTLTSVDETVRHIDEMVVALDSAKLSKDARVAMRELRNTSAAITTLASRLEQRDGLVTRMERASTAVGDLAMGVGRSDRELAETLDDVGDAARAIRRLADALERDPDMLLKGRAELGP